MQCAASCREDSYAGEKVAQVAQFAHVAGRRCTQLCSIQPDVSEAKPTTSCARAGARAARALMMRAMGGSLGIMLLATLIGCASASDDSTSQPAGTPYWAAGSTTNEGKSTHLWIVNRAIAILGAHQELPRAARAYARLTSSACSARWRQGLDDADHNVNTCTTSRSVSTAV